MNYIAQINAFWEKAVAEDTLGTTTIALYFALLQVQNLSGWKTTIRVHPRELMNLSKIGSSKTLYQHLERLKSLSLIQFESGTNQYRLMRIGLVCLYPAKDLLRQKLPQQGNSSETARKKQPLRTPVKPSGTETTKPINYKTLNPKEKEDQFFPGFKNELLKVYSAFVQKQTQLPPKINQQDLAALDRIASYLEKSVAEQDSSQNSTNQKPLDIWKKLFEQWHKLSSFYQTQISLAQIEKNLMNNLFQTQKSHASSQTDSTAKNTRQRTHASRKNFNLQGH